MPFGGIKMPYITNFIFKQQEDNGKPSIIQAILINAFPGKTSFSIQFTILLENPFIEHSGFVEFCRRDNDAEVTLAKSAGFTISAAPKRDGDNNDYAMLTGVAYELGFSDLQIDQPGLHVIKVHCNKKIIAEFAITVAEQQFIE